MPGSVTVVVDTNLFHECKGLDDPGFPWADLGPFDEIVLLVSDTVLTELDDHKKTNRARLKRRAIKAGTWFRGLLSAEPAEHVFREAGPRVVMRISVQTPDTGHPHALDLSVNDDKIVAVAVALRRANPQEDIRLLSDDTRPLAKARAVGVPFETIPERWRRQEEVDDAARTEADLRAEIQALRANSPDLKMTAVGAVKKRLSLTRDAFAPLTETESAALRAKLANRYSLDRLEAAAQAGKPRRPNDLSLLTSRMEFLDASETQKTLYREQTWPDWLDKVIADLGAIPRAFNRVTHAAAIAFQLDNAGSRPAEDVRIVFRAKGGFRIAPVPIEGDVFMPTFDVPKRAPPPPVGHWLVNGDPVGRVRRSDPFAVHPTTFDPNLYRFDRNDEDWYYEPERPTAPVTEFCLEARRFRHRAKAEVFNVLVFPDLDAPTLNGSIEIELAATNIGSPIIEVFPVDVASTYSSSAALVWSLVDDYDLSPIKRDGRAIF